MAMLDDGEVHARFARHRQTEATGPAFEVNHSLVRLVAETWNRTLPPGREAALALTALEEALMHANAAVARRAGPDWQLEPIDVSVFVDDVLEHLEGPLHLRSAVVGGGGGVQEPSGGDLGPQTGAEGTEPALEGVVVPGEGIAATHLTPEQVQGLVERSGPLGPADELARRARVDGALEREVIRQRRAPGAPVGAETAPIGPVGAVGGPDRALRGVCPAYWPADARRRCERVAGHDGLHVRGAASWS